MAGGVLLLLLPLLPLASSSMQFQLSGSVYPAGYFYVTMRIGEPEKPYFLDIDTGSTLTWLECGGKDRPSCPTCNKVPHPLYRGTPEKVVPCADPLCDAQHRDLGTTKDCTHKEVCKYKAKYLGGETSLGLLLLDKLALPTGTSPTVAFGCGYDQLDGGKRKPVSMPVDGILGLGRGSLDLVSQLKHKGAISKNVISHYLSTRGGGHLSIGEDDVAYSRVAWLPMAPGDSHYSPGLGTLHLDTKSIGTGPLKTIFDSGSTYTYLPERVYVQLVSALKASLSKSLKEVPDHALKLCWKGPKPFKTLEDLKKEFKPVMSLKFDHGVTMTFPPENYLIITERGNACFGILPMKNGLYLVGAISMQDKLMIYDNEKGRIGWTPSPSPKL